MYPYPTYFTFSTFRFENGPVDSIKVVIGGGTKLATSDEMMLSTGIIFSPVMWYNLKAGSGRVYNSIFDEVSNFKGDTLYITTSQGGGYPIFNILYMSDYEVQNPSGHTYKWGEHYLYLWKKNDKVVVVNQDTYPKQEFNDYIKFFDDFKYKKYLHLAFWDWERWYLNKFNKYSYKLNEAGFVFVTDSP